MKLFSHKIVWSGADPGFLWQARHFFFFFWGGGGAKNEKFQWKLDIIAQNSRSANVDVTFVIKSYMHCTHTFCVESKSVETPAIVAPPVIPIIVIAVVDVECSGIKHTYSIVAIYIITKPERGKIIFFL